VTVLTIAQRITSEEVKVGRHAERNDDDQKHHAQKDPRNPERDPDEKDQQKNRENLFHGRVWECEGSVSEVRSQKSEGQKAEGRRQKAEGRSEGNCRKPVILRERRRELVFATTVRATEGSQNARIASAGAGGERAGGGILQS
jgi:hypothetical protein